MEAVSLHEAREIQDALLNAKRVLWRDGTVRLAVEFKNRDDGDTGGGAPIGRHLVLRDTISASRGEVKYVVAAKADFVTRVSDGRLFYVREVSIDDDGEPLFSVEEPKPWRLPRPPPDQWTPANAEQRRPITLRSDEIELAAEYSTFNQIKHLVVVPLTKDTGLSYCQSLGATPLYCVSAAMGRGRGGDGRGGGRGGGRGRGGRGGGRGREGGRGGGGVYVVASRRATHFFSWSFAQQVRHWIEAYSAFVTDNGLNPNTVYTWISPLSEDQNWTTPPPKEEWAAIFKRRICDIGHVVLLFSPWKNAAPLGRMWCLFELFIAIQQRITITVQLPPQEEAAFTRALLGSEVSVSMLIKGISTREADASDPKAEAMIRAHIEAHGGYEAVDAVIRTELERALVRESYSSAISAASRSELRAIVLTEGQDSLVSKLFFDAGKAKRGRWRLNVPASSGKSYIAVHLVGRWATASDGGPSLYVCHHVRMQQHVIKQVRLEFMKELGISKDAVVVEDCAGVEEATWVRSGDDQASVLVATIDGVVDLGFTIRCCTSPKGRKAWRGSFAKGGAVVDEAHVVFGHEKRDDVAGQHRLPAKDVRSCVEWLICGGGRLVVLGDENQLNVPHDAKAVINDPLSCLLWPISRIPNCEERALAAAWPVSLPVYPKKCETLSVVGDVATMLQVNLRNPHTVRDASAMLYNEFARDGEYCVSEGGGARSSLRRADPILALLFLLLLLLPPLIGVLQSCHAKSAEGRELQAITIEMSGKTSAPEEQWFSPLPTDGGSAAGGMGQGGALERLKQFQTGGAVPFASAEDYAIGVAEALLALYRELSDDTDSGLLNRVMVAVLTPHSHVLWGGREPRLHQPGFRRESKLDFAARLAAWDPTANASFRSRLRSATVAKLRDDDDEAAGVLASAVAHGAPWLVWDCVENFVGLDIPLVVMAGFDPTGMRNKSWQFSKDLRSSMVEKRDPLAYMAMTRATHGTVVVEPHAGRFCRHYRIDESTGCGVLAGIDAEEGVADGPHQFLESCEEMFVVVGTDGQRRLCSSVVDLRGNFNSDRSKRKALAKFPMEIVDPLRAGSLLRLLLDNNQIAALPEEIGLLTRLEVLSIGANKLKNLPYTIGLLMNMKILNIKLNKIKKLPDAIASLTGLKEVYLSGNPFSHPQSAVVESWVAALRTNGAHVETRVQDSITRSIGLGNLGVSKDTGPLTLSRAEKCGNDIAKCKACLTGSCVAAFCVALLCIFCFIPFLLCLPCICVSCYERCIRCLRPRPPERTVQGSVFRTEGNPNSLDFTV